MIPGGIGKYPVTGPHFLAREHQLIYQITLWMGNQLCFFKDFDELNQKFERYIIKSDEWFEIARNGQKHFFKYHTPQKRAEYILSKLNG